MDSYVIEGKKNKLNGVIEIQGSKNAALPILAASILTSGKIKLENVASIEDIKYSIEIIKFLGGKVTFANNVLDCDMQNISYKEIPVKLKESMRSSILFDFAILSRFGKTVITKPGGCKIGDRPIDYHIEMIVNMGYTIKNVKDKIYCNKKNIDITNIEIPISSVGITENMLILCALIDKTICISNCAMEPEVVELCNYLSLLGVLIKGIGTRNLTVTGKKKINSDMTYHISSDRIVAGTYLLAVAAKGGKIILHGVKEGDLHFLLKILKESGCFVWTNNKIIYLESLGGENILLKGIETSPFPGFPTDLQPIYTVASTITSKETMITETIFNNRFNFALELQKMGAKIIYKKNSIIVYGNSILNGGKLYSKDLRGGASLIIAGILANGETIVIDDGYIKRGYEDIVRDLRAIGVEICKKTLDNGEKK